MNFKAFKMDGLGNDFVIIDCRSEEINLSKKQVIKICNRDFLGCDQLIIINKSNNADAELIFYNSDGSESYACGNGTRCVAFFIFKETKKSIINLKTKNGFLKSEILDKNLVETVIGKAKTNWRDIPISKNINTKNLNIKIEDNNKNLIIGGTAVNVGNPHVVFFVDNIDSFDLKKIGPMLEKDELFPERCNVTIAKIENKKSINVKVWERGVGLTKACGSAACATAFAGKINGLSENKVKINFKLGSLSISIDAEDYIRMKGPVSEIEDIDIKL
tara:strand:+ start:1429 stop:2253 length:825 start_codon:yes stop_codon:yes gene_type:complete